MEFTDVIEKRYSCKNYSARKVEDEKLTAILNAGRVAPTAKNFQEQRIYVVRSEDPRFSTPTIPWPSICLWHGSHAPQQPIASRSPNFLS